MKHPGIQHDAIAKLLQDSDDDDKNSRRDFGGDAPLTITSLMDIMTIMLVFLLVTITSDPLSVRQDSTLKMPLSTSDMGPKDTIPVIVNKKHIIIDNEAVVPVDCKIGGQICTEEDIADRSLCLDNKPECTPDLKARTDAMSFSVDKQHKEDASDAKFLIVPVHKKLQQLVKEQKEENARLGRPFEGIVTFVVDTDMPFRVIAEMVYSAGMAELHDMRFAVVRSFQR